MEKSIQFHFPQRNSKQEDWDIILRFRLSYMIMKYMVDRYRFGKKEKKNLKK